MASGKWIPDVEGHTLTEVAAQRALAQRLGVLREALGAARAGVDDELENVHQLRVSCRRAEAAVALFSVCLPPETVEAAQQTLKRYRRAAGKARDCDVQLLDLGQRLRKAKASVVPGLDMMLGYSLAQRVPAQDKLEAICPGFPGEFDDWAGNLLRQVQPPASQFTRLADLGRATLRPQFEAFWQQLQAPAQSWEDLHAIRILAKRLRYAVELLAGAFPEQLRESIYPQLGAVQTVLGEANDGYVGAQQMELLARRLPELYRPGWSRWSPLIKQLLKEHHQTMDRAREAFERWRQQAVQARFDLEISHLLSDTPLATVGDCAPDK